MRCSHRASLSRPCFRPAAFAPRHAGAAPARPVAELGVVSRRSRILKRTLIDGATDYHRSPVYRGVAFLAPYAAQVSSLPQSHSSWCAPLHCHVEVRSAADYASSSRGFSPFGILIVLVIAGGGFFYFRSQPAISPGPSPSVAAPPTPVTAPHFATAAEAQREAVRLYPALSVEGSPLNRAFVARHKQYQQQRPDYFSDPSWPVTLAREVASTTNSK